MKRFFRILAALLVVAALFSGCDLSQLEIESKNGDAAKRPNLIENYELKVFLLEQDAQTQENLFALYYAITHFEQTCYLPYPMPQERTQGLLSLLCYSCPELFQVDLTLPTTYRNYEGNPNIIAVDLPYCMDQSTYDTLLTQAKNALSRFDTAGMTVLEAEKYIYDKLCQTITYSTATEHCGNVYGALVEGQAKCDGISKAMAWAMEHGGFPCLTVSGQSYADGIGHAWNIVPIDGHFYHLDLTADIPTDVPHDSFYPAYNISSSFILSIYAPSTYFNIQPEPSMEASYHALAGNYFDAEEDWKSAVKKLFVAAYKQRGTFIVQFSSDAAFALCKDSLESLFREAARSAGIQQWSWTTTYLSQYRLIHVQVQK